MSVFSKTVSLKLIKVRAFTDSFCSCRAMGLDHWTANSMQTTTYHSESHLHRSKDCLQYGENRCVELSPNSGQFLDELVATFLHQLLSQDDHALLQDLILVELPEEWAHLREAQLTQFVVEVGEFGGQLWVWELPQLEETSHCRLDTEGVALGYITGRDIHTVTYLFPSMF